MKRIGLLLMLLGALAGVIYPLYGLGFSGDVIDEAALQEGTVVAAGPIRYSAGKSVDAQIPVRLSPADSPVRIVSKYDYVPSRGMTERNTYAATLTGPGGEVVWEADYSHAATKDQDANPKRLGSAAGGDRSTTVVQTFSVEAEGDYRLDIKQKTSEFVEERIAIQFRRNVMLLQLPVVIGGIAALVLGLVMTAVGAKRDKQRRRAAKRAAREAAEPAAG